MFENFEFIGFYSGALGGNSFWQRFTIGLCFIIPSPVAFLNIVLDPFLNLLSSIYKRDSGGFSFGQRLTIGLCFIIPPPVELINCILPLPKNLLYPVLAPTYLTDLAKLLGFYFFSLGSMAFVSPSSGKNPSSRSGPCYFFGFQNAGFSISTTTFFCRFFSSLFILDLSSFHS